MNQNSVVQLRLLEVLCNDTTGKCTVDINAVNLRPRSDLLNNHFQVVGEYHLILVLSDNVINEVLEILRPILETVRIVLYFFECIKKKMVRRSDVRNTSVHGIIGLGIYLLQVRYVLITVLMNERRHTGGT